MEHPASMPLAGRRARLMFSHTVSGAGPYGTEGPWPAMAVEMPSFALPNERRHIHIIVEGLEVPEDHGSVQSEGSISCLQRMPESHHYISSFARGCRVVW